MIHVAAALRAGGAITHGTHLLDGYLLAVDAADMWIVFGWERGGTAGSSKPRPRPRRARRRTQPMRLAAVLPDKRQGERRPERKSEPTRRRKSATTAITPSGSSLKSKKQRGERDQQKSRECQTEVEHVARNRKVGR